MALQEELLAVAATRVKQGGRLVYTTCSVLPCENEDPISKFLAGSSDFRIRPARDTWQELHKKAVPSGMGDYFHATPLKTGTDGFFCVILERRP
jgi:16S rRNA (cytosine967-C5)-methyltransferase